MIVLRCFNTDDEATSEAMRQIGKAISLRRLDCDTRLNLDHDQRRWILEAGERFELFRFYEI